MTLLVVRPRDPGLGMGHYLWYFLTSAYGEAQIKGAARGTSVPLLTARSMARILVPMPSARELDLFAQLVEASEAAYASTIHAARLRREGVARCADQGSYREGRGDTMRNPPCP